MSELGKYAPLTYFQLMEVSLRELLVEKGVVSNAEVDAVAADMKSRGPERGARVVARAWTDPAYKRRLLADGTAACEELGLDVPALRLVVVENTPEVHNVIVCTLCSCYPRMLLGLPPDWYKSSNYRKRVVREPRAVLAEFGTRIPDERHDPRARFDRRHALHGAADAPGGHRGLERGAPGGHRDARLDGRRRAGAG